MLAARFVPPSMGDLMLAGHSASSCDLSIPVQDFALNVQALEPPRLCDLKIACSYGTDYSEGTDSSTLPAPRKFCTKSGDHECSRDSNPVISSIEIKRALRQKLGLDIVKDEAALWSSSAEAARQASVAKVSKLFLPSELEKE